MRAAKAGEKGRNGLAVAAWCGRWGVQRASLQTPLGPTSYFCHAAVHTLCKFSLVCADTFSALPWVRATYLTLVVSHEKSPNVGDWSQMLPLSFSK
jgi:hypothetical protein